MESKRASRKSKPLLNSNFFFIHWYLHEKSQLEVIKSGATTTKDLAKWKFDNSLNKIRKSVLESVHMRY